MYDSVYHCQSQPVSSSKLPENTLTEPFNNSGKAGPHNGTRCLRVRDAPSLVDHGVLRLRRLSVTSSGPFCGLRACPVLARSATGCLPGALRLLPGGCRPPNFPLCRALPHGVWQLLVVCSSTPKRRKPWDFMGLNRLVLASFACGARSAGQACGASAAAAPRDSCFQKINRSLPPLASNAGTC